MALWLITSFTILKIPQLQPPPSSKLQHFPPPNTAKNKMPLKTTTTSATSFDNSKMTTTRKLPILLFDVMDTIVRDPFYHDVPAFFGMSMKELLDCKHPTAWIEFEKGLINEEVDFCVVAVWIQMKCVVGTRICSKPKNFPIPSLILTWLQPFLLQFRGLFL